MLDPLFILRFCFLGKGRDHAGMEEGLLTGVLGNTHQGVFRGGVLHDAQGRHEGAGRGDIDDDAAAEIALVLAAAVEAVARALGLHDRAGGFDEEQGAFDVDVEEGFEFRDVGRGDLGRALHAELPQQNVSTVH